MTPILVLPLSLRLALLLGLLGAGLMMQGCTTTTGDTSQVELERAQPESATQARLQAVLRRDHVTYRLMTESDQGEADSAEVIYTLQGQQTPIRAAMHPTYRRTWEFKIPNNRREGRPVSAFAEFVRDDVVTRVPGDVQRASR